MGRSGVSEIEVTCPRCAEVNAITASGVPERTPLSCSQCGEELGQLRDLMAPDPDDRPDDGPPSSP